MINYGLPVTQLIHNTNHIRFARKATINRSVGEINAQKGTIKFPKIFRQTEPGIYKIQAQNQRNPFYINIYSRVWANENIIINNINSATYNTSIGKYPIQLYEEDKVYYGNEDPMIIKNSLNDYLDLIMINGTTNITYDRKINDKPIFTPCNMKFLEKIGIHTWNKDKTNNDYLLINLKHELRAIPSMSDVFILDAENQRSYILRKVGHYCITGMEEISRIESFSSKETSVYFIKYNNVKRSGSKDDLICTHFKSADYESFRKMEFTENAICISDDEWRGKGFYIKISNQIAPNIEDFIKLLNGKWFKKCKLEVLFPLDYPYQSNVLVDEYHIRTFTGETHITVDNNYPITYFYKTMLTNTF